MHRQHAVVVALVEVCVVVVVVELEVAQPLVEHRLNRLIVPLPGCCLGRVGWDGWWRGLLVACGLQGLDLGHELGGGGEDHEKERG